MTGLEQRLLAFIAQQEIATEPEILELLHAAGADDDEVARTTGRLLNAGEIRWVAFRGYRLENPDSPAARSARGLEPIRPAR